MSGCVKWAALTSENEGSVYMSQAYGERSELTIYKIDSLQIVYFGASIAGFNGATQDVTVNFEVDTSLITQFNADYAYLNYDFVALPADAYTVSGLTSTIKKGASDSDPLSLSISASGLDGTKDYCLPIKITSISKGILDTTLSVAYFMIDSLYIRSRDITSSGTLTVSNENSDGSDATEGSVRLTDDDYTTKFLYTWVADSWMQLKFDSSYVLNAYTLTSGNDEQSRDPYTWQLQASNDGTNWTVLDERTAYTFSDRLQTVTFEFNQSDDKAYSYYRLYIIENYGATLFQLEEWRLLQYY
ncbi:MAG: DUF1735 domain-containing protein [Parafilimonas sp.]